MKYVLITPAHNEEGGRRVFCIGTINLEISKRIVK